MILEACVESAESAVAAAGGGADRVELCANLVEGGTTPSEGTMLMARARVSIPIYAMIRPRGGDFCYTELEREIMFRDIEAARRAGMDGVVVGVLGTDGAVDVSLLRRLVEAARPMGVTFHRAFDVCRDASDAIETLADIGVERILTSGQSPDVIAGMDRIIAFVEQAGDRLSVMPGGGITSDNVGLVVRQSGAREFHVYAPRVFDSPMAFRNPSVFMGDTYEPDEYRRTETDATAIAEIRENARSV